MLRVSYVILVPSGCCAIGIVSSPGSASRTAVLFLGVCDPLLVVHICYRGYHTISKLLQLSDCTNYVCAASPFGVSEARSCYRLCSRCCAPLGDVWLHSSSCMKGLAISSLPSTGEMTTRRVPRATIRPSLRYRMFPSSSAISLEMLKFMNKKQHTCQCFFNFVEDEIHELVIAFERADDCCKLA